MPSPFPGMDPFVESQEWSDFHHSAIDVIRELLTPRLGDRYAARIERRVYVEPSAAPEPDRWFVPDFAVHVDRSGANATALATAEDVMTGVRCRIRQPDEHRESYLVIRDLDSAEVVTVIELLSPTNKRPGATGRAEYIAKRDEALASDSNLVEIDLLRGGARMPIDLRSRVEGDYAVIVSRVDRRPDAELFVWPLPRRMPTIPIPLRGSDPDVPLALQAVLDTVYDRARYGRTLRYDADLVPPADDALRDRVANVLKPAPPAPPTPAGGPPETT